MGGSSGGEDDFSLSTLSCPVAGHVGNLPGETLGPSCLLDVDRYYIRAGELVIISAVPPEVVFCGSSQEFSDVVPFWVYQ